MRSEHVAPRFIAALLGLLTSVPAVAGLQLGQAEATPSPTSPQAQQNQQILEELRKIRLLLERVLQGQAAPRPTTPAPEQAVKLSNLTGYVLGKPDAPLTIVEFSDLECPYCRQFHMNAFEPLKKAYIDTGKVRFITRDFPLTTIHSMARDAARASRCAGEQGRFWEMRHEILAVKGALIPTTFTSVAANLKLNAKDFTTCMAQTGRFDADLTKDLEEGERAGVNATPSFVIGKTTADGIDGVLLIGAPPFPSLDARLKALLPRP